MAVSLADEGGGPFRRIGSATDECHGGVGGVVLDPASNGTEARSWPGNEPSRIRRS